MVRSRLINTTNYEEDIPIEIEKDTPTYEMKLYQYPVLFVLGKKRQATQDETNPLLYYPIYAISRGKIKYCIGVYEIFLDRLPHAVHSDNESWVDPNLLGKPLLFKHVYVKTKKGKALKKKLDVDFVAHKLDNHATHGKLDNHATHGKLDNHATHGKLDNHATHGKLDNHATDEPKQPNRADPLKNTEPIKDPELFQLHVRPDQIAGGKKKIKENLDHGIFEKQKNHETIKPLPEQTETLQKEAHESYRQMSQQEQSRLPWVARFTQDPHYTLELIHGTPDSFFASVVAAFRDTGNTTTVKTLRALLANQVSDAIFQQEQTLYQSIQHSINQIDTDKQVIDKRFRHVESLLKTKGLNDADKKQLHQEIQQLRDSRQRIKQQQQQLHHQLRELTPHMHQVLNTEQFRDYVASTHAPQFTANAWAIETLGNILHFETILFQEEHQEHKDTVISLLPPPTQQTKEHLHPRFYIFMTLSPQGHYALVRYKDRALLTFPEIPYGIKMRLLTRSMENRYSRVHHLDDFVQLRSKMGLIQPEVPDDIHAPLSDPETRFVIYANAPHTSCDLENLPLHRRHQFLGLHQCPTHWRRLLSDDSMESIFLLDKQTWQSVTHYLHALPYKESHPAFHILFTKGQPFSKEKDSKYIDIAKAAAQTGRYQTKDKKDIVLRPPYIPCKELSPADKDAARYAALRAKITQNEDLRRILQSTDDATLLLFSRGEPLKTDASLMRIRTEM